MEHAQRLRTSRILHDVRDEARALHAHCAHPLGPAYVILPDRVTRSDQLNIGLVRAGFTAVQLVSDLLVHEVLPQSERANIEDTVQIQLDSLADDHAADGDRQEKC